MTASRSKHHWVYAPELAGGRCVCGLERLSTALLGCYIFRRDGKELGRGRRLPKSAGPCTGAKRPLVEVPVGGSVELERAFRPGEPQHRATCANSSRAGFLVRPGVKRG